MKKVLKVTGIIVALLAIILIGLIGYVKVALPNVGAAPDMKVVASPEMVEHGKYLANTVCVCIDCHSTRDWTKFAGPITPATAGKGGDRFDQTMGLPGVYYAKNITPSGISRYTDGELYRLITTGVNKEGKAIFPLMPYPYYGRMDPEDIRCIIAYVRTLTPIPNNVPASVSDFPMSVIINMIPKKAEPQKRPDPSNRLEYGAYLTNAAGCRECHTQVKQGQIIPELAFSGGREFLFPDGSVVRSANITSDEETGIGSWSQEAFVNKFRAFADSNYHPATVAAGAYNSIMPWNMYGKMNKEDLESIYTYIHSIQPIKNNVTKFTPKGVVAAK